MAVLANGQKVLQGVGMPHSLSFAITGGVVTVPAASVVPNYVVVTAAQYALLAADAQFTPFVSQGKILVLTDVPTDYVQQQYKALKTVQDQLNWCKAMIITLGGPALP